MGAPLILVVEDEEKIKDMVAGYLTREGFRVQTAVTGLEALQLLERHKFDLVVLDWMLPGLSGLEVCKQVRQKSDVPIIMLTARSEEVDKLLGLELGADDYITKPFSLRELVARIKVVLRRSKGQETSRQEELTIGDLYINFTTREVRIDQREIELTPTEFALLSVMARHPGRVFSRMQLLDLALGEAFLGYERSVDTHISNLRKKIEKDPGNPEYILTVYGVGYKFRPR
ncbi:MAG: response regulator transcription factor [Thermoanaerobacteraceae bacterium]|uniref:response regulator transcription factor n=1 Tax=Thermanaeromonas sp. C210 TaxID=2731925 RepID=UPI00155CFDE4|nr:response regulator transcription factor [Thermanaeromonas sp. C210]MBE3582286.1 response regulator transcription factor [Thermoanaerobacteraceae bacterium]GFN22813.1 DNA-binding response regulator [Thermanaeromonas sp. C210]